MALVATGCASSYGISLQRIDQADKAIADAKLGSASLDAAAELKVAEEKLAEAKAAVAKQDYTRAIHLAEQAAVDADYARTKAGTEKLRKIAHEVKQNIHVIRQELERLPR